MIVNRPIEFACGHVGRVDDDGYNPENPWVMEHPLPCPDCEDEQKANE
jgi:hypothetical protein